METEITWVIIGFAVFGGILYGPFKLIEVSDEVDSILRKGRK